MEVRELDLEGVEVRIDTIRKQAEEQMHEEATDNMAKSMLLNPETPHVIYEGDHGFPPKTWGIVVEGGLSTLFVELQSPFWDEAEYVQVAETEVTTASLYG